MFAWAGLLGIDVEVMLNGDPFERRLRERIAKRAFELKDDLDDTLALKIINRLAEAINK